MKCWSAAPIRGDQVGLRRNLFVCRALQAMNQAPNVPFVEQPRAHAATAQRAHATQISAALLKRVEHIGRIIVADDADQSWPGTPERRTERTVQSAPPACPIRVAPSARTTSSTSRLPNRTTVGVTGLDA